MENFKGSLFYYRVYDIGPDVDLQAATEELSLGKDTQKFRLRRSSRAMVIDEAPVVVSMGNFQQEILGQSYNVLAIGKIWSFGAVSICLRFDFSESASFEKIKDCSIFLEHDEDIQKLTYDLMVSLVSDIEKSNKKKYTVWDQYEDYLIFIADPSLLSDPSFSEGGSHDKLYELILLDKEKPSEQTKAILKNSTFYYGKKDIAILDWNSALVLSEGDASDVADVIEFSLCQLLELRYYDDLLDKKLNILYKSIQQQGTGIFDKKYSKLANDSSLLYIEISEVIERIENSLKVIGDFYFAKIYRTSLERFRFLDWKQSVDQKLKSLAELSILFQNQVNEKKNQLMEVTIILLIAIEVIPLLYKFIKHYL